MTSSSIELIKLLTSFDKIDLNCRDRYQRTPLHFAAGSRLIDNVKLLTSLNGVDLNAVDKILNCLFVQCLLLNFFEQCSFIFFI